MAYDTEPSSDKAIVIVFVVILVAIAVLAWVVNRAITEEKSCAPFCIDAPR